MIAVALPEMGVSLAVDPGDLTLWLVTSYLLVNIILQSPAGKLGDMIGRRRAFDIGLALFAIGVAIAEIAPYLYSLALSRVFMAAGGAMLMPNAMALLRTAVPESKRSYAFGYFGAVLSAAAAIGPLIGGILTINFGWKAIFLVNLPLLLISFLLVRGQTDRHPESQLQSETEVKYPRFEKGRFDFIGMLLLGFSLSVIVIGMKSGGLFVPFSVLAATAGFFAFARWESRVKEPLIDLHLFHIKPLVFGGVIIGLQNLAMYALLFQMPFLMMNFYNLEVAEIGQVLLTLTLFMVVFAPFGGKMVNLIGSRKTILLGLLISVCGLCILLATAGSAVLYWLPVSLSFVGAGIGLANGPVQSVALSAVDPRNSGVASGMISTLRYLGGIIGIMIISLLLVSSDPEVLLQQGMVCFGLYLLAYLIAMGLAIRLPDNPVKE